MKRVCRRALLVALVLLVTGRVEAASHHVRAAATGLANGTDWTNACTDFTGSCAAASLVRGDTYYVATGNYAGRTFNTGTSGTALITVRGATLADHGTSTGWQTSYAVDSSQAHFLDKLTFNSSYWVVDGAAGSGATASAYGFIVDKPSSCSGDYTAIDIGATVNITITNLTIAHVAFVACTQDIGKQAIFQYTQTNSWNSSTVSHCLFDGWQNAIVFEGQGNTNSDNIFEYNYMRNAFSSSAHHGEQVDVDGQSVTNLTVRYNIFADCFGTACVAANNSPILGGAFYGNIVGNADTGNGIFGTGTLSYMKNVLVHNNTFYSSGASPWWFGGCVPGAAACSSATGNVAENNLIWNMPGAVGGGISTRDYNAYFQSSDIPSESHGQTSSSNPFVNASGGNFHLAGATTPGLALSTPYNVDRDGITRGADGVWDRGALEYAGQQPSVPKNFHVTP